MTDKEKLTLDPKHSKAAKAHGAEHGHTFGRLTIKDDQGLAKCRTDGCAVLLEVTADDYKLVPDDNGVVSCVAKEPDPRLMQAADPPPMTAYSMAMEESNGWAVPPEVDYSALPAEEQANASWQAGERPEQLPTVAANALLMGKDAIKEPDVEVDSPGTDNPFALELPPAPILAPQIVLPNNEQWYPERDLIDTIETAITNHPRSQQTLIGPSEIGTECDRCLGKKLLGIPMTREVAWLPQVGTAVHDWLDGILTECQDCGWITERKVTVGIIGNRVIRGRCDAYKDGVVVDFKVVGKNTLTTVRTSGPSTVYRVQDHLYGRGYELDGYEVTHVALLYLPRNEPTLAASQFHIEPYDRSIAIAALDRANRIHDFVTADSANILELQKSPNCYDCFRFAPLPGEDAAPLGPRSGEPFAGILS